MKLSPFERLGNRLFGFDWFVSYAWVDGRAYAGALVAELQRSGLRVFLDRREVRAGDPLKDRLARALHRSRGLLVVGSPAACDHAWVRAEVDLGQRTRMAIVPIDFGIDTQTEAGRRLRGSLDDLKRIDESLDRLAIGPSPDALQQIQQRRSGLRVEQVQRRWMWSAIAALLVLAAAAVTFAVVAEHQRRTAVRERDVAVSNDLVWRSRDRLEGEPAESARLAVAAARQTFGPHGLITVAADQQMRASRLVGTSCGRPAGRIQAAVLAAAGWVGVGEDRRILRLAIDGSGLRPPQVLGEHLQTASEVVGVGGDATCTLGLGGELWRVGGADSSATFVGSVGGVGALVLAIARDGGFVVGRVDGAIERWHVTGPAQVERTAHWPGHTGPVVALASLRDGRLVSAGLDDRVVVWNDQEVGVEVHRTRGGARALAVGPNDEIACGGGDGRLVVCVNGRETVLGVHGAGVGAVCFAASDMICSGDERGCLGVWRQWKSNEARDHDRCVLPAHGASVKTIGVCEGRLWSLDQDGEFRCLDLDRLAEEWEPRLAGPPPRASADGQGRPLWSSEEDAVFVDGAEPPRLLSLRGSVAAPTASGEVRAGGAGPVAHWLDAAGQVWSGRWRAGELSDRTLLGAVGANASMSAAEGLAADVVLACGDAAHRLWRGAVVRDLDLQGDLANCLAVAPGGERAAIACRDGAVHVWSVAAASARADLVLHAHRAKVRAAAFGGRGGRWLVSVDEDGAAWSFDLDHGGRSVELLRDPTDQFYAVAAATDRARFVFGGKNGIAHVVDVGDGAAREIAAPESVSFFTACLSADGDELALGGFSESPMRVDVVALPAGEKRSLFAGGDSMTQLAFSPTGRFLAGLDAGGTVRIWRLRSEELLRHAEERLGR